METKNTYNWSSGKSKSRKIKSQRSFANSIALVQASVVEELASRCSKQVELNETRAWLIFRNDLALETYKIDVIEESKPLDHSKFDY